MQEGPHPTNIVTPTLHYPQDPPQCTGTSALPATMRHVAPHAHAFSTWFVLGVAVSNITNPGPAAPFTNAVIQSPARAINGLKHAQPPPTQCHLHAKTANRIYKSHNNQLIQSLFVSGLALDVDSIMEGQGSKTIMMRVLGEM